MVGKDYESQQAVRYARAQEEEEEPSGPAEPAPITGLELELVEKSDPGGPASCARLLGKAVLSVPPVYSSMYVAAENPGLEGERPGTTHFFLGIEPARALEY
ncbi:Forkhead Box Protein O3 [Manis pentadactyla]|nr:Forkhead Box Protein O3 [Manis pentadactyla]